jgi:glycosyltransferase involved in cell wall biosynthesis
MMNTNEGEQFNFRLKNHSSKPQLTVALVSMNNPLSVRKTLNSLLLLQNESIVIVVIDSSINSSVKIICEEFKRFFNVNYFHTAPRGVYNAMNVAIDKSNIDSYIWFLNPGDILINSKATFKLVSEIHESGFEWGFAQAQNDVPQHKKIYPITIGDFLAKEIALGLTQVSHQAIISKTSTLKRLGKFDEKFVIASDLQLILKLADLKFSFVEEILVRIDLGGLSSQRPITTILESNYIVYVSGYRGRFKTLVNLAKSLLILLYGTAMKKLANLTKKWKIYFEK